MEMSSRARRMERAYKLRKQPALNLISLMDIFTILVFFLLVTSSSTQPLPSSKDLKLPDSIAKKAPEETLVLTIVGGQVLVQGRPIVETQKILNQKEEIIQELVEELRFQSNKKKLTRASMISSTGFAATIMGDEELPFELLDRILKTCRQANYTKIAFAANQKSKN